MSDKVQIEETEILADKQHTLKNITYQIQNKNAKWKKQSREIYDPGNAATVLLYNKERQTIILTKQFRLPSYINGNKEGMLIETCAGKLDGEHPEEAMKREIEEETGYKIPDIKKIMEAYMSPGSVTEKIYFYVAPYAPSMKVAEGGGLKEEGEDIEVMEIPFAEAVQMLEKGEIKDGKTIILLQYAKLHKLL